ncbi:MAG: DNA-binding protein [Sphingobacteriales bacterium]|nr:MAG: DNA-binding protein [Sphingobacteriales bacterium]
MTIDIITKADLEDLRHKIDLMHKLLHESNRKPELKLYTNATLSEYLGVTPRCLQNWRDKGLIEFSQIGHSIYYTQKAVDDFLEGHKVKKFN